MKEKIDFFESIGFDVDDGISEALLGGFCFDLTALALKRSTVFEYILCTLYNRGLQEGIKSNQAHIKRALGMTE